MSSALIQLPCGDWVRASDVVRLAVGTSYHRGNNPVFILEVSTPGKAEPRTEVVGEYPTESEALAARDLLATNINAALLLPERKTP